LSESSLSDLKLIDFVWLYQKQPSALKNQKFQNLTSKKPNWQPTNSMQRQVAKLASELFCYWSLLRNNKMAMNLEMFTSSFGGIGRRFVACGC